MMAVKKRITAGVAILALCVSATLGTAFAAPPVPEGRALKVITQEKFPNMPIGTATGWSHMNDDRKAVTQREFNIITPENDFKFGKVHSQGTWNGSTYTGVYNWTTTDAWRDYTSANNIKLRIHTLAGPQISGATWLFNYSGTQLTTILHDHIDKLLGRYKNNTHMNYIDVVNEAVNDNGTWRNHTQSTDKTPWTAIGYDTDANATPLYIKQAFLRAAQVNPNAKLVYNDYGDDLSGTKWTKIKQMVTYLKNNNVPIHAIGWQGHVNKSWSKTAELAGFIEWCIAQGLEFHLTELDVTVGTNPTAADYDQQALVYQRILDTMLKYYPQVNMVFQMWGFDDANNWRKTEFPTIFDASLNPKKAYYALQSSLEGGLLKNGGFEPGIGNWTGLSSSVSYDTSVKRTGGGSLRSNNRTADWTGPTQDITEYLLKYGQGTYKYDGWIRTSGAAVTGKITVRLKVNNTFTYHGVSTAVDGTAFKRVTGTKSLTWSGTLQEAVLLVETPGSTTSFNVDDLSLVKQ